MDQVDPLAVQERLGAQDRSDTIPRVAQLVAHMRAQLAGMRDGTTFEEARLRATSTARALSEEGTGRDVASRVGDRDKMWSTTADVLAEGMHLGFVAPEKLPSSRRYLDQHRDRAYRLTEAGQEMARLASDPSSMAAFYDCLVERLVEKHPHFRALLRTLHEAPLILPEVGEEDVKRSKAEGRGTAFWAQHVVAAVDADQERSAEVEKIIREFVSNRFRGADPAAVTNKATAAALNEAMTASVLHCRGLAFGPTDLKMISNWGMGLLVLDQSRYAVDQPEANTIWLASDITETSSIAVSRRGASRFAADAAAAIVDVYRQLARSERYSALEVPYIPIHLVRAPVALRLRVTRALVDLALEALVRGVFPDLRVRVDLHLGNSIPPPTSEPVYRRGGARKYVMTIRPAEAA